MQGTKETKRMFKIIALTLFSLRVVPRRGEQESSWHSGRGYLGRRGSISAQKVPILQTWVQLTGRRNRQKKWRGKKKGRRRGRRKGERKGRKRKGKRERKWKRKRIKWKVWRNRYLVGLIVKRPFIKRRSVAIVKRMTPDYLQSAAASCDLYLSCKVLWQGSHPVAMETTFKRRQSCLICFSRI